LATLSFWLINLGLPATLACALLDWPELMRVAASLLGLGLIMAAANIWGITQRRTIVRTSDAA
jgi:hypothetical protein